MRSPNLVSQIPYDLLLVVRLSGLWNSSDLGQVVPLRGCSPGVVLRINSHTGRNEEQRYVVCVVAGYGSVFLGRLCDVLGS